MTHEEFQLEVVDRLARIETKLDSDRREFIVHVDDNDEKFTILETQLQRLVIDSEVAKRAGRKEGRKTGAKWAAAVSTGIIALAEAARAWMR